MWIQIQHVICFYLTFYRCCLCMQWNWPLWVNSAITGHVLQWEKQSWEVAVYWIACITSCQCQFALHECSVVFVQFCIGCSVCWWSRWLLVTTLLCSANIVLLTLCNTIVFAADPTLADILKLSLHNGIYMGGPADGACTQNFRRPLDWLPVFMSGFLCHLVHTRFWLGCVSVNPMEFAHILKAAFGK